MTKLNEALRLADALIADDKRTTRWEAADELRRLHAENERLITQRDALLAERDHARDHFDRAVKLLTSIHSCIMYPSAVKLEDGRLMIFRPENPHEYLQALSDRIRALPDEIAAIRARGNA